MTKKPFLAPHKRSSCYSFLAQMSLQSKGSVFIYSLAQFMSPLLYQFIPLVIMTRC